MSGEEKPIRGPSPPKGCATCCDYPDKAGVHRADGAVHHPHCFFAGVGEPSWKGISFGSADRLGDERDTINPDQFGWTYPVRLNEKGERVAGHKNPPPPGGDKAAGND